MDYTSVSVWLVSAFWNPNCSPHICMVSILTSESSLWTFRLSLCREPRSTNTGRHKRATSQPGPRNIAQAKQATQGLQNGYSLLGSGTCYSLEPALADDVSSSELQCTKCAPTAFLLLSLKARPDDDRCVQEASMSYTPSSEECSAEPCWPPSSSGPLPGLDLLLSVMSTQCPSPQAIFPLT